MHWVARGTGTPKHRDDVVYYETIKRELNKKVQRLIVLSRMFPNKCSQYYLVILVFDYYETTFSACSSTQLTKSCSSRQEEGFHTGLCGRLEHLKIETRLMDERFASVLSFIQTVFSVSS
jgi:hypothetical protein